MKMVNNKYATMFEELWPKLGQIYANTFCLWLLLKTFSVIKHKSRTQIVDNTWTSTATTASYAFESARYL